MHYRHHDEGKQRNANRREDDDSSWRGFPLQPSLPVLGIILIDADTMTPPQQTVDDPIEATPTARESPSRLPLRVVNRFVVGICNTLLQRSLSELLPLATVVGIAAAGGTVHHNGWSLVIVISHYFFPSLVLVSLVSRFLLIIHYDYFFRLSSYAQ